MGIRGSFMSALIIAIFIPQRARSSAFQVTIGEAHKEDPRSKTGGARKKLASESKSGEVDTAIWIDGLAGDEAASGEQDGDARDFIDRAVRAYRKAVGSKSRQARDHVGFNESWGDGVDGDSLFSKEKSIGTGEAEDSCFGCGIVRAHDTAILRRNRRQIDDAAP